jgi:hypothetical protein
MMSEEYAAKLFRRNAIIAAFTVYVNGVICSSANPVDDLVERKLFNPLST